MESKRYFFFTVCIDIILAKRNKLMYKVDKIYERTVADTEGIELEAVDSVVDHICSKFETLNL